MKRSLPIILAAMMILTLAGCGKTAQSVRESKAAPAQEGTAAAGPENTAAMEPGGTSAGAESGDTAANIEALKNGIHEMVELTDSPDEILALDDSRLVAHNILDASGQIIADKSGAFYDAYLPVVPGEVLKIEIASPCAEPGTRRIYFFDGENRLLNRPVVSPGDLVRIEQGTASVSMQIFYIDEEHSDKGVRLVKQERTVWEPAEIPDTYAMELGNNGYGHVYLPITYDDFLSSFWDYYLGSGGSYTVSKSSLGQDAKKNGTEIFYYTFSPKEYAYTVLLSAGMNACELSPAFGLAYFMKGVMEDARLSALKNGVRFVVLPILCPSSFNASPKAYLNPNGVRINKNFDYNGSWLRVSTEGYGSKGRAPDSEAETQALKEWLQHFQGADLYIDCHADLLNTGDYLFDAIYSDEALMGKLIKAQAAMTAFYMKKGYAAGQAALTRNWLEPGYVYPKTLYAKRELGIPSVMIEQWARSAAYGSDPSLQNDSPEIMNYATMIEQYVLYALAEPGHSAETD